MVWKGILRENKTLPDMEVLTPELKQVIDSTEYYCKEQIREVLQGKSDTLPFVSEFHDLLVGNYCYGFINGQFLVNKADQIWAQQSKWAKEHKAPADFALMTALGVVLPSVFGLFDLCETGEYSDPEFLRSTNCFEKLYDMHSDWANYPKDWINVEKAGGMDGMAVARGGVIAIRRLFGEGFGRQSGGR